MEKISNLDVSSRRNLILGTAGAILTGAAWEVENVGRRSLATRRFRAIEIENQDALLLQRRLTTAKFLTRVTTDSFALLRPDILATETMGDEYLTGYMYLPYRDMLFTGAASVPESGWQDLQLEWLPVQGDEELDKFWQALSTAS